MIYAIKLPFYRNRKKFFDIPCENIASYQLDSNFDTEVVTLEVI